MSETVGTFAAYAATAMVLNRTWQQSVLPLFGRMHEQPTH